MIEEKEKFLYEKNTIDELLRSSLRYTKRTEFYKFINFINRMKHYSRFNSMLIYSQNPEVTFFGGTSYWKNKHSRSINANSRPYIILAPMSPVMVVYDLKDTIGVLSPDEFIKKGLGRNPHEVIGEIKEETFKYAIEKLKKWGVIVNIMPLPYFDEAKISLLVENDIEITLKQGLTISKQFAVLIHEVAHLFLGHTKHEQLICKSVKKPIRFYPRELTTSSKELEAETVSYLICHKLGIEIRAAEYLSRFIESEEDIYNFSFETVIKTTDKIEDLLVREC